MRFQLPAVYPILDTASLERRGMPLVPAAEALLEGGAAILQLRHKGFWGREMFDVSRALAKLCAQSGAIFIVNDRADFAALTQSAGLHLGQDDLTPADARRVLGPGPIIGLSTHNPDQLRAARAEPVDYVAFGPVFPTASKERPDAQVGVEGLRLARALTDKPLVAIGGITRDNASTCFSAGADSVAVIADLLPTPCTKQTLRDRMDEWRQLNRR